MHAICKLCNYSYDTENMEHVIRMDLVQIILTTDYEEKTYYIQ